MAIICPRCRQEYDITLFEFGQGLQCDCGYFINPNQLSSVQLPIDGILDLHAFMPSDVRKLLPEYIHECRQRGILRVRIIHGKGIGALKRTVEALLSELPEVDSFHTAPELEGGWGATIVKLKSPKRRQGK